MRFVIAYYVIDNDTYEFSYAQLVNLDTDELVQIKKEDDFLRYKDNILLPNKDLRISSFTDFLDLVVTNCDSIDALEVKGIKCLVLAVYINGVKLLELGSGKVYSYHKSSMLLSRVSHPKYDFKSLLHYGLVSSEYFEPDTRVSREYNPNIVCRIKDKLDLVHSELDMPWLELYNCGSGKLILDKFQSMEGTDLIIFPSELKYLVGVTSSGPIRSIHCGTLMFTTNTKYIQFYQLNKCVKCKKLLLSRKCGGLERVVSNYIEYID